LAGTAFGDAHAADNGLLTARWRMGDGAMLRLKANLSNSAIAHERGETTGTLIWGGEPGKVLPSWSVSWRLEAR
jgi:maltooligosyltrehalose trehalohydrolase